MAMQTVQRMTPGGMRKERRPKHTWHLKYEPFQIVPHMICRVLPGETMTNCLINARTITAPITNRFIGWWLDHYVFYVKLSQLAGAATYEAMLLDPNASVSAQNLAADSFYFHNGSGPSFVKECHDAVVAEYFRLEGESVTAGTINSRPAAKMVDDNLMHSLTPITEMTDDDFNVDTDSSATIEASEVWEAWQQWQNLQSGGLIDMSYEDYLAASGVRPARIEQRNVPELVRYKRDWQYPVSAIDPSDGTAASAASWTTSFRADKRRFFDEPGFLFGCVLARPKLYSSTHRSTGTDLMTEAARWFPPNTRHDQSVGWCPDDASVFHAQTNTAWIDLMDLMNYGEQYLNFDFGVDSVANKALNVNFSPYPQPSGQKDYTTDDWVDSLYVSGSAADGVQEDGVCQFTIQGVVSETSPRVNYS